MKSASRRVLVSGLGVVSPIGIGASEFWNSLVADRPLEAAGPVKGFTAAKYLRNERHARVLNRTFELLVGAAALAAADACLEARPVRSDRLATAIAVGPIDHELDDLQAAAAAALTDAHVDLRQFVRQATALYPLRRLRTLPNIGTAVVSIEHRAMGPSVTLVSGHAGGLQALACGLNMIRDRRADAVLCGAADSRHSPTYESAAILVLEAEDSVRSRGVRGYAELVACAETEAVEDAHRDAVPGTAASGALNAVAACLTLSTPKGPSVEPVGTSAIFAAV